MVLVTGQVLQTKETRNGSEMSFCMSSDWIGRRRQPLELET